MRSPSARWLLAILLFSAWMTAGRAQPVFTDVTVLAGVDYLQHVPQDVGNCISFPSCEPDRMTGGAAVADVDGDGRLDLFVTRLDAPDILFLGQASAVFADGTSAAGLASFDLQSNGAAFCDVDNDGDPDLIVTVLGEIGDPLNSRNYLFINDGSGVFSEEAIARGAALTSSNVARRPYSVTCGDYDRDGWPDLHFTEWIPAPGPGHARLLRNRGSGFPGRFEDVTVAAGVVTNDLHGFASAFVDLDQDGWQDLAIAADFGTSRLYWNNGDGTFTEGTLAAGVGTDENGMGSTFGDWDGDGDLDWFVTSIYDANESCEITPCNWGYTGNRLYRYDGGRLFSDATDASGTRDGQWGWGAAFFDYDNDGDLDLTMTNGVDLPGTVIDQAYVDDPMRLWRNDGPFPMTEIAVTAGLTDTGSGKGLLVFDYDADGDLDLFVVNNGGRPRLYRNDGGNQGDWLRVDVRGSSATRDGWGARVVVQPEIDGPAQTRVIGAATHFLGQSERTAHFGLTRVGGPVERVLVHWPGGKTQGLTDVARNSTVLFEEANCADVDGDNFCSNIDCDDGSAATFPGASEVCDGLDNDCDGLFDETCAGLAGAVPDGHAVPGTPLRLDRGASNNLLLTWGASCSAQGTDYEILEGTLGDFDSHTPRLCTTGGARMTEIEPRMGSRYYLVVPSNGFLEGSHGRTSDGTYRPAGPSICLPRAFGPCT